MIELARPGFLIAGALLALVPLALHFIARRPPERAPLPTTRFLRLDARTAVRVRRRPADLVMLALRVLLLVLLGAAFAGPTWSSGREGTETVVLLDAGAGMAPVWPAALDSARARLGGGGTLIVFDTAATVHRPPADALDALASTTPVGPAGYAAALGALLRLDRTLPDIDSASVTLITVPRWSLWRAGVPALRAAWPGAIDVLALMTATPVDGTVPRMADAVTTTTTAVGGAVPGTAGSVQNYPAGNARIVAPSGGGMYLRAALGALGYGIADSARGGVFAVAIVDASVADAETIAGLATAARGGATILVHGSAAVEWGALLPWAVGSEAGAAGPIAFDRGLLLEGVGHRLGGEPAADARVVARWLDGRPAAAARSIGTGCVLYIATDLEGGALPLAAGYPDALRALLRGCEQGTARSSAGTDPELLDSGALALLRGGGDATVSLSALAVGDPAGRALTRPLLALALLIALMETWLAYRRQRQVA